MHLLKDKKFKIISFLLFFLTLSSINNYNFFNKFENLFNINEVEFNNTSEKDKQKFAKIFNNLINSNIFHINKTKVKNTIENINIIENYKIKKIYPNKLEIDIQQTRIVAKVIKDKEYYVGENGKLIEDYFSDTRLPMIFGKYDKDIFLKFLSLIKNSSFQLEQIDSIFIFKSGRYDISLKSGILIKLPNNNPLESLKLADILIKDKKIGLNKVYDLRNENIVFIDE